MTDKKKEGNKKFIFRKANYVNIFLIFEIAIFSHQVLSN